MRKVKNKMNPLNFEIKEDYIVLKYTKKIIPYQDLILFIFSFLKKGYPLKIAFTLFSYYIYIRTRIKKTMLSHLKNFFIPFSLNSLENPFYYTSTICHPQKHFENFVSITYYTKKEKLTLDLSWF